MQKIIVKEEIQGGDQAAPPMDIGMKKKGPKKKPEALERFWQKAGLLIK